MDADRFNKGVSLAQLFPHAQFFRARDIRTTACCTDHQRCRPGDLYVALVNDVDDGHDCAENAVRNGAIAVLTERLLPVDVPQCVIPNTHQGLGHLCQQLAGNPADHVPVIGIAGKRGKSATQTLVANLLTANGHRPAEFGATGYTDGFEFVPRKSQATSATGFAKWLSNIVVNGCSHAVTELPRREVAKRSYDGARLQALLLTGFSCSNWSRNVSAPIQAYFDRLLAQLPQDRPIIANVDCPLVNQLIADVDRPLLTVSMGGPADLTASLLEQFPSEQTFLLEAGNDTIPVRTKIIGSHHVRNCLLTAALGLALDMPLPRIVEGLETVQRIPGNLERVECGQPFSVFVDSASKSHDLHTTLETVRGVTSGRLICLYGEGNTTRSELRSRRGRVVELNADLGVITSDDAANQQPLRAIHDVLDGYDSPANAHVMPNRTRAIEWALGQAKAGDSVVIVGPHNRTERQCNDAFFPDADVARYWLLESVSDEADWIKTIPR